MIRPLLKYTTARWWLWRHRDYGAEPVHFRTALSSVRRVLVHFPTDVSGDTVRFVHEKIAAFFPQCTIDYLIERGFPDDHQEYLKTTRQSDDVIVADDIDRRWLPFLSHHQLALIRHKAFDLAIDFAPRFNITYAHALQASGASIIVGFSVGNGSRHFHNLHVNVRSPEHIPARLFDVLSRLRS